jgi:hypothetical protein
MTTSTKGMMAKVKQLVPPMLEKFHKGLSAFSSSSQIHVSLTSLLRPIGSSGRGGGKCRVNLPLCPEPVTTPAETNPS